MKTLLTSDRVGGVLFDVQQERARQDTLQAAGTFPWTCADVSIPDAYKLAVLAEEFGEASVEVNEMLQVTTRFWPGESREMVQQCNARALLRRKKMLREELIQIAAVCVAWCEALDEEEEARAKKNDNDMGADPYNPGIAATRCPKEVFVYPAARLCMHAAGHDGECV